MMMTTTILKYRAKLGLATSRMGWGIDTSEVSALRDMI